MKFNEGVVAASAVAVMLGLSVPCVLIALTSCAPKQTDHPGEIQVWCRLTGKVDSGDSSVFKSYIYSYECPKEGSVVAP